MVTYTGNAIYRSPHKPRIRIYAFNDTTYATPLYSYDPFTDAGTVNKPVSLQFESLTTNAGTFSLEIEDTDSLLDPDLFMRGNRVFIDCSKDGSTYQAAYKGLVRSSEQNIYAASGRNLVLNGFSYLIRLNERIVNLTKQATITGGKFDRTDSTMFTNNLVNDILTTDGNYIYSTDDTALYSVLKNNNITGSAVDDFVAKLDAQFVTVSDAINSVLEFSNSLIMVDFSTDQLELYNPQQASAATSIFLLTNQMNLNADDADITMYPDQPYKYNVSYDYPDSGSRLIISYRSPNSSAGTDQCPAVPEQTPEGLIDAWTNTDYVYQSGDWAFATLFTPGASPITKIRLGINCQGDCSGHSSSTVRIYTDSSFNVGTQVGSDITVYRELDGIPTIGTAYPNVTHSGFVLGMLQDVNGPTVTPGTNYWLAFVDNSFGSNTVRIGWIQTQHTGSWAFSSNGGSTWTTGTANGVDPTNRFTFASPAQAACGGSPAGANDVFCVAHDRNASGKIGVVERALTGLPPYLIDLQTINEYLYNKLYISSKPRFTFDFPSVTMPGKLPKAGDIVCHVDRKANVGLRSAPIQTGIITQVSYDFNQGDDGVLGLRRLALSTTGVRRGYY